MRRKSVRGRYDADVPGRRTVRGCWADHHRASRLLQRVSEKCALLGENIEKSASAEPDGVNNFLSVEELSLPRRNDGARGP